MCTNVLIPLDGSKSAEAAVDEAVGLAPTLRSAHLVLIELRIRRMQMDDFLVYRNAIQKAREGQATDYFLPFRKRLESAGVRVETGVVFGDPVRAIAELTRRESFDLILLGAEGGWLERRLGPSHYANRLARNVDAEVRTVPEKGRTILHRPKVRPALADAPALAYVRPED